MKRLLAIMMTMTFAVMMLTVLPSKAATYGGYEIPITIKVNNQYIASDVNPFLENGTTFVPIRFISEALRADNVQWDSQNKTAIIDSNGKSIRLPVNQNHAYVNEQYVAIREGVKLINGRTFVPLRFISETLGAQVNWTQSTYTVDVNKSGVSVPSSSTYQRSYTDEDLSWLAKIIHAESRGESMQGKIAVGNVILNRKQSNEFPNTIWGVIFDKKYGTQFEPVANGTIYNTPSNESIMAAKLALEGTRVVGQSLYFMNPAIAQSSWIAKNRPYLDRIGNHVFYL